MTGSAFGWVSPQMQTDGMQRKKAPAPKKEKRKGRNDPSHLVLVMDIS